MRLKHQSLSVGDADVTAAFYVTHFGYAVTKHQARPDAVRVVLERPDHRLQLLSGGSVPETEWRHHLAYVVAGGDFDLLSNVLPQLKAPYRLHPNGSRLFFALDPDGHAIEIIEEE
ncbi:MAG: VOC family protein [Candidatus Sericytochromatia bacterium]|nr:VOC family protein [Candidatus Sericytochromatia bacterium]